jgi:hypothetical protein
MQPSLPVDHRGRLDGDEIVEPVVGQHEAAGMLRQVARHADQLAGKFKREAQAPVVHIEIELRDLFLADALLTPAPDQARERLGEVLGQAQGLADLAHRAARAIAGDDRGERGAGAAVGIVDPLDDLLAPLMLEIDVDIGRLAAFARDEALEEELVLDRIDAGDAEHEADAAVRRRAAPLAQDAAAPALGDCAVDGEEIGRVAELADQPELVRDLVAIGWRHTVGEHPRRRGLGQLFERVLRGQPLDHPLVRVLVAEFAKVEGAGARDRGGGGDGVGESGEAPLHLGRGFEMPVGVPLAPVAERVDRAFLADRGDDVLQQPRLGGVVEDVADRHRADARRPGECGEIV